MCLTKYYAMKTYILNEVPHNEDFMGLTKSHAMKTYHVLN